MNSSSPEVRPLLGELQLSILRRYGSEHDVEVGDVLFADGDPSYDLVVILEGTVDIVDHLGLPDERLIISYGPREFLGEMGLLTGQSVYLSAVATSVGRVLRVSSEQVMAVMTEEPELSDLVMRSYLSRHARVTGLGVGPVLVGSRFDVDTKRLLEVFARNRLSARWMELESSRDTDAFLSQLDIPVRDLPIVVLPGGTVLHNPTALDLLDALGLAESSPEERTGKCDLLIVGGGPAGLAASVYGASEGLSTTLAEGTALGGQAGTSTRIENYLGFPAGLSGEELAARAALQARKFGVRVKLGADAVALTLGDVGPHQVRFSDGETVSAESVIIATGVRYNHLTVERLNEFEGVGIYYAATLMEANACGEGPVSIVGGGNSAGQAALYLARKCADVNIFIRGESLSSSMSRYLINQINRSPYIRVFPHSEVVGLVGAKTLEALEVRDSVSRKTSVTPSRGLFVFIGATPCTEWLDGQLARDEKGFVLTGSDLPRDRQSHSPLVLETSARGIFCVGDVRSRSIKRVAAAIGEGSMAVRFVFERIEATGQA